MFVADPNSLLSSSEMVPGDLAGHRLRPPGAIHLWQGGGQPRTASFEQHALSSDGVGGGGVTISCQDCGNQAKKDCSHRRCRTCCKSRGFDCRTHVKSTWVPATRRRERQAMAAAAAAGASSGSTSGSKKPRLIDTTTTNSHTSTSNTPPGSLDTTSSHQEAGFKGSLPGQVWEKAVFKCVRVTAVEDGKDEFAYQAAVTIGGHVFKGFLYDQGPLSGDCQLPNVSDLHLGGGSGGGGAARNGGSSSTPLLDPSDVVYGGGSGGGFLGGSSYDQLTVLQPPSSREA